MIYSMTAFARAQSQNENINLVCEIRSINHRYLEVSMHLPEAFRVLEMPLRDVVRDHLKRGKVECVLRYHLNPNSDVSLFDVNMGLAQELCKASESIAGLLKQAAPICPTNILRYPGVIETKETDLTKLEDDVFGLMEKTLKDLIQARAREGEELKHLFLQRMDLMQAELFKVRERMPFVIKEQHEKILKRFADVKLDLDPGRLEQEMVLYVQRVDVMEEIERAETHINEVRRILKDGGMVGRRLDFLLQELNREANTLGSKSTDSILTRVAVELKVLIEQVREQVQNVE